MPPRREGPEWDSVEVLEEKEKGLPQVKCKSCHKTFNGGATRIREHILGISGNVRSCSNAVSVVGALLRKKDEETAGKKRAAEAAASAAASCSASSVKRQRTIAECAQEHTKATLHATVASFFYANGIPFNVARSQEFKDMVHKLTNGTYKPPGSEALRTNLLDKVTAALHP